MWAIRKGTSPLRRNVIPAQAGTQEGRAERALIKNWIPAFAGTTISSTARRLDPCLRRDDELFHRSSTGSLPAQGLRALGVAGFEALGGFQPLGLRRFHFLLQLLLRLQQLL